MIVALEPNWLAAGFPGHLGPLEEDHETGCGLCALQRWVGIAVLMGYGAWDRMLLGCLQLLVDVNPYKNSPTNIVGFGLWRLGKCPGAQPH